MIKLIGGGGSQIILAAGYLSAIWLIKTFWARHDAISDKLMAMLALQFSDAEKRRELWDAQAKVIEGQTTTIKDLTREVAASRADVAGLRADLTRIRQ